MPSLAKSYKDGAAGRLQRQQSVTTSNTDVNISSLKHTTGKNSDAGYVMKPCAVTSFLRFVS